MTTYSTKKQRAIARVQELQGFYGHLAAYLIVNSFISTVRIFQEIEDGETFLKAIAGFDVWALWLFWGIGLFFHTAKVFAINPLFGKNWEDQQIRKILDRERDQEQRMGITRNKNEE